MENISILHNYVSKDVEFIICSYIDKERKYDNINDVCVLQDHKIKLKESLSEMISFWDEESDNESDYEDTYEYDMRRIVKYIEYFLCNITIPCCSNSYPIFKTCENKVCNWGEYCQKCSLTVPIHTVRFIP